MLLSEPLAFLQQESEDGMYVPGDVFALRHDGWLMGSELSEAATSVDLGSREKRLHEDDSAGRPHTLSLGTHGLQEFVPGIR